MKEFRTIPKKEEYPMFITSEDKDAVIDLMLKNVREDGIVYLDYKMIKNSVNISSGQYEAIIRGFIKDELIERYGSKSGNYGFKFRLLDGIQSKKERGGYCIERDAYMAGLQNLQLQLEKVQKELSQTTISKINSVISGINNISDLTSNIGKILDIIRHSLPSQ